MPRVFLSVPATSLRSVAVAAIRTAALVAVLAAAPPAARAEDAASFGQLEKETLADGMARLQATIDPAPQGKTVGQIRVVNEEVFSRRDWLLQLLNYFHRTTRETVMAREVLLRPGQLYDQSLIDETVRNLQAPPAMIVAGVVVYPPELSSVIAIVPVISPRPGEVDLLVVTRDVWSLRFNTAFEYQGNRLTLLDTSLSENNLFGWRKSVAFRFRLDQGAAGVGPSYFDPNIHGTRLTLYASATLWYARDTQRYDGNNEIVSLRYPLYSLASRWGGGVDVTHTDTVVRVFRGGDTLLYDFRQRRATVDTNVIRAFRGLSVVQRVTAGHLLDDRRFTIPSDAVDPVMAEAFLRDFAPPSERRSEPYLRYEVFTPRYLTIRDLDTFDLRETLQLGPRFAARVGYGLPALGADFTALSLSATASWAASPAGGYAKVSFTGSTRLRDGRFIDQLAGGQIFMATPMLGGAVRVVTGATAQAVRADTQNYRFFLGGSSDSSGWPPRTLGLRGYEINEIEGTSMLVWHAELRSRPLPVFSQRVGGLLFYDGGAAGPAYDDMVGYHDFGVGARWLIPQLNSAVLRFDWAVATADAILTRAGLPGRFSAGFAQAF